MTSGEIDKLAEQYGVADMLCLGDEEAADKTEESTDAAEENADSDEAADADAAEDEAEIIHIEYKQEYM